AFGRSPTGANSCVWGRAVESQGRSPSGKDCRPWPPAMRLRGSRSVRPAELRRHDDLPLLDLRRERNQLPAKRARYVWAELPEPHAAIAEVEAQVSADSQPAVD